MSVNKISGMRFREELQRGHDILSNEPLIGEALLYKKDMYDSQANPTQAWQQMTMRTTQRQNEQADQADAPPPKSEGKASSQQAAAAAEGESKRSQHPVISTRS